VAAINPFLSKERKPLAEKKDIILDSLKTHGFSRVMRGKALLFLHRKTFSLSCETQ